MGEVSGINWRILGEAEFNRLAEQLIQEDRTNGGLVAQAVDGRGGDGGIDIDVRAKRTHQLVEILQLKYFPEGFSNGFKFRRRQIKDSFERAMDHGTRVWTLVVPANLTPQERKTVWSLSRGRKVRIQFIGRTELDNLLARYPYIHAYAMRDSNREALGVVHRDSAALNRPGDLESEVRRLAARDNAKSIFWGTNLSIQNSVITTSYYAKRPDATEREPLKFRLQANFGKDDQALRAMFEDTLAYGPITPFKLPSHVIASFTKVGPEWFAEEVGSGDFWIGPPESDNQHTVDVVAKRLDGRRLGKLSGKTETITGGSAGMTLVCVFPGGLKLTLQVPERSHEQGKIDLSFDPATSCARDIRRVLRFLNEIDEAELLIFNFDDLEFPLKLSNIPKRYPNTALAELIDDLVYIENELDIEFRYPAGGIDAAQRIWIRTTRGVLEGRCLALPNVGGLSVTIQGEWQPALDFLEAGPCGPVFSTHDEWTVQILGEELVIEGVGIYHPNARVDEREELIRAFKDGTSHGMQMDVVSNDGSPFVVFSTTRRAQDASRVPEPWNIPGIAEHRHFA